MTSELVAVTGANGFVGGHVLAHLNDHGIPVVGLVRAGRVLEASQGPKRELAQWTEADLCQGLEGATTIVHAASVVHRPGATPAEYRHFNVNGTAMLIAAARSCGVRRIVFLSSIKVYGEEPVGVLNEETAVDRSSPYSATKIDAERLLLEAAVHGGPSVVILRLCPVYGKGDKGNVRRVATAIARRRFVVPGDGSTRKSIVHWSTVADAVRGALLADLRGVFVLADRVAPSMRELSDIIAGALGRSRPPGVPVSLMLGAAGIIEVLARLRHRTPSVSRELVRKSLRQTVCSPSKLEDALGRPCHVELREGIREEVAWLRREHLL